MRPIQSDLGYLWRHPMTRGRIHISKCISQWLSCSFIALRKLPIIVAIRVIASGLSFASVIPSARGMWTESPANGLTSLRGSSSTSIRSSEKNCHGRQRCSGETAELGHRMAAVASCNRMLMSASVSPAHKLQFLANTHLWQHIQFQNHSLYVRSRKQRDLPRSLICSSACISVKVLAMKVSATFSLLPS